MSKMWRYILFAVAATALGTTVEVLYYGPCTTLLEWCWWVAVMLLEIRLVGLSMEETQCPSIPRIHVIFRIYKNMTIFISPVISKEYQGEYDLLSLLFLIFDAFSEPSELICSNSSGHSATVNSGIRAASLLVNSSTLMFFQHLFSSLPELGGGNLFMHDFIGGVNGDCLHFEVDNDNLPIGFDRHNLVDNVLSVPNPELTVVTKLAFVDRSIPNQILSFLMVVTNKSRVNVSLLSEEWVYVEVEYKTPKSTSENESTRPTVENTSGQQYT